MTRWYADNRETPRVEVQDSSCRGLRGAPYFL